MDLHRMKSYAAAVVKPRDAVLTTILKKALLEERLPPIQLDDMDGRLLQFLTMLAKPKKILEIGTLFGYSTIFIARGAAESTEIISLEVEPHWAAIARENLQKAGIENGVHVIVADAKEYLQHCSDGPFDMVFIDADKKSYPEYLKLIYPLVSEGGLIVCDDTFGFGHVLDREISDASLQAAVQGIRMYNQAVCRSGKLFSTILTTAQGMTVSVKLPESEVGDAGK